MSFAMARRPARSRRSPVVDEILEQPDTSVLDLLDRLLNKGVMLTGDITMGVAGVDLIYLRLSSLFCATDRIFPADRRPRRRRPTKPAPGPRP
jgi:gas vesicle structural protein